MRKSVAAICLAIFASASAAQEKTVGDKFREVTAADFISAFVNTCVDNPGRLDKVAAIAAAMNYPDTPEPFWTMLAPQEPDAPYQNWFAIEGLGTPYFLGISEGEFDGKQMQICAVSNPFLAPEKATSELKRQLQISAPTTVETLVNKQFSIWEVPEIENDAFLTIIEEGGGNEGGTTLSMTAPKLY